MRLEPLKQGRIKKRGGNLHVVVHAGLDPVTGRRTYKRETIRETDDAAWKRARNKRTESLAEVLKQCTPPLWSSWTTRSTRFCSVSFLHLGVRRARAILRLMRWLVLDRVWFSPGGKAF